MEKKNNFNNSESISPENNYKFDNYGIVLADSIEDLLYDKYFMKNKYNDKIINLKEDSSEIIQNEKDKSNRMKNNLESKSLNTKSISLSGKDENEEKEYSDINKNDKSYNIDSLQHAKNSVKDISVESYKIKNILQIYENKKIIDTNNIKMIVEEKKKNKINENLIDEGIKNNEEKKINNIIDENINNKLKMIRCKEFHIKNNDKIKDKETNKVIKIILNVNNKEKKQLEINQSDSDTIKNISIYTNSVNKKEVDINSDNIKKNEKNKIGDLEEKGPQEKFHEIKDDLELNSGGDNIFNKENNSFKNKKSKINMFLKSKQYPKDINNKDILDIKNIHLISSLQKCNNNKNNIEKKQKFKYKKNLIYNVPISTQCFIDKIRSSGNIITINKIIPKKGRIFITKTHGKRKNNGNHKIMSLPYFTKCHIIKENKIINVKYHIPLKSVLNKNYFISKQLKRDNEKNIHMSKISNEEEENNEYSDESIKPINNKINVKKRELDNRKADIDIEKNDISPNIIIKIINPSKSYKYGKIDIKTKASNNNMGKSNSCHRFIFNNSKSEKILPFNIKSNKRKIKKIKILNSRKNQKESAKFEILKNSEIVNALNSSCTYKSNCPACILINRRKKFAENLYRNFGLKNKKFSESEKNIKIKTLRPHFSANFSNIKNKLFNLKNEEEKIEKNKYQKYKINLFSGGDKVIIDGRNNSIKNKNNSCCNSVNKYSNYNRIEFPAIDSYFH